MGMRSRLNDKDFRLIVLKRLADLAKSLGTTTLTKVQVNAARETIGVSSTSLLDYYGEWQLLMREAGLQPRGRQVRQSSTRESLLKELLPVVLEKNNMLSSGQIDEDPNLASDSTYCRLFHGYANLFDAVVAELRTRRPELAERLSQNRGAYVKRVR